VRTPPWAAGWRNLDRVVRQSDGVGVMDTLAGIVRGSVALLMVILYIVVLVAVVVLLLILVYGLILTATDLSFHLIGSEW
jgi:hypothetical protein